MLAFLVALVVFALAGIGLTALMRRRPVPVDDLRLGLAHLAGLRWRDFARLVLEALQARGYDVIRDGEGASDGLPGDGGDILLIRGTQRTLLSCKYGNASVVGAQSILGLGKSAELRGAHAAIVVSPGRFDDEARRVAAQQNVELIDGATLWPEVKPFVGQDLTPPKTSPLTPARIAMAWVGAALVAAVAWLLVQGMQPDPPVASDQASESTASAMPAAPPAPSDRPAPRPAEPVAAPPPPVPVAAPPPSTYPETVPTDAAALEARRAEVARAISTLAGIDRAVWSTQSTMIVYLSGDTDPSATMCPLLERYPELAASRLQLQPPAGSERTVRFKQCRPY